MNAADIPLPHGPQARFIEKILERSEDTVTAAASPARFAEHYELSALVDLSEWTIEILAQAAPLLLTPSSGGGVIAGIKSFAVHKPLTAAMDTVFLRLRRLSDRESRFPRFRGAAAVSPDMTPPLAEAEFTLSLPGPEPSDG